MVVQEKKKAILNQLKKHRSFICIYILSNFYWFKITL